jgi:hypothetical protein
LRTIGRPGDERAVAPARLDDADLLEFAVGARDGVRGEAEVVGEAADGGQLGPGDELTRANVSSELLAQLLERRRGRG